MKTGNDRVERARGNASSSTAPTSAPATVGTTSVTSWQSAPGELAPVAVRAGEEARTRPSVFDTFAVTGE